jgi:hypothetical protein
MSDAFERFESRQHLTLIATYLQMWQRQQHAAASCMYQCGHAGRSYALNTQGPQALAACMAALQSLLARYSSRSQSKRS